MHQHWQGFFQRTDAPVLPQHLIVLFPPFHFDNLRMFDWVDRLKEKVGGFVEETYKDIKDKVVDAADKVDKAFQLVGADTLLPAGPAAALIKAVLPDKYKHKTRTKTRATLPFDLDRKLHDMGVQIGERPSRITPAQTPRGYRRQSREVTIADHPVGGKYFGYVLKIVFMGGPLAAIQALSHALSDTPDPTNHWVLIVGGYYHELVAGHFTTSSDLVPAYWNDTYDSNSTDFVTKKVVGTTRKSDQEIAAIAAEIMNDFGFYDVINNNCQHFVRQLVGRICESDSANPDTASDAVVKPWRVLIPKSVLSISGASASPFSIAGMPESGMLISASPGVGPATLGLGGTPLVAMAAEEAEAEAEGEEIVTIVDKENHMAYHAIPVEYIEAVDRATAFMDKVTPRLTVHQDKQTGIVSFKSQHV